MPGLRVRGDAQRSAKMEFLPQLRGGSEGNMKPTTIERDGRTLYYNWWISSEPLPNKDGQISFDDEEDEEE